MVTVDRNTIVAALTAEWETIAELCAGLDGEQWEAATDCPGWSVKDNVSHITGTERMLLGDPAPDVDVGQTPHVRNDIGRMNELWIAERRPWEPAAVLDEFREVTAKRLAALRAMTQADFDAESWTPAGTDTYGRFMRIRTLDCWVHEQDIRGATGRAGHLGGPVVDVVLRRVRRRRRLRGHQAREATGGRTSPDRPDRSHRPHLARAGRRAPRPAGGRLRRQRRAHTHAAHGRAHLHTAGRRAHCERRGDQPEPRHT